MESRFVALLLPLFSTSCIAIPEIVQETRPSRLALQGGGQTPEGGESVATTQAPEDPRGYVQRPVARQEITLGMGVGEFRFDTDGPGIDGRADALFLRFDTQPTSQQLLGFGLSFETFLSDDDLFAGRLIDNGIRPLPADAEAVGIDLFPHAVLQPVRNSRIEVPARLGFDLWYVEIDHWAAGVERSWLSFGPRVSVEPRVSLSRSEDLEVSLFGGIGTGFGYTSAAIDYPVGDDRNDAEHLWAEVAVGVRFTADSLIAELAYRHEWLEIDDHRLASLGSLDGVDLEAQGLYFTIGVRF